MMNPSNYRLGNLLREVNTGKIVSVIGLNIEPAKIEVSGNFEGEWQVEEIPITREIFKALKFTLVRGKEGEYYEKDDVEICVIGTVNFFFISGYMRNSVKIFYVSQLQNLYLDLTGEHLGVSALNPEPIPQP